MSRYHPTPAADGAVGAQVGEGVVTIVVLPDSAANETGQPGDYHATGGVPL
jgi:hypothetical protein